MHDFLYVEGVNMDILSLSEKTKCTKLGRRVQVIVSGVS